MIFFLSKVSIFTRVQETSAPMTYLLGKFGLIKNVDIDQTVPSILKANSQVYCHYIHTLTNIIPYCVSEYNFFKL